MISLIKFNGRESAGPFQISAKLRKFQQNFQQSSRARFRAFPHGKLRPFFCERQQRNNSNINHESENTTK
jgi:hypothetical protein